MNLVESHQIGQQKPVLKEVGGAKMASVVAASHPELGDRFLYCEGMVPLLQPPRVERKVWAAKPLTGKGEVTMRTIVRLLILLACCSALSLPAAAQEKGESTREVYTGTIVSMSGRSRSVGFTLSITGRTTDDEAQKYLSVLAAEGQDALMRSLSKNKLGYFAATGQTGRDLLVVRDVQAEGNRRIIAVFERWIRVGEARSGHRSLDYPFAILEIFFDAKGKGSGTFIGAAQVRIERDKKTEQLKLEIENFGTFPAKLVGVLQRGKK